MPVVNIIVQMILVLFISPLLNGIIKQIKAKVQHRKGAPVLQLYYDLFKLFKKDMVISGQSSWIFRAAPYVYITSALAAAAFVPVVPQLFSLNFAGDAILVVYILAMGRFFITLSALDTGSTFGGMGSSREMMISSLIEPSLIVTLFTIALNPVVNSTSLSAIYKGSLSLGMGMVTPVYFLLLCAMMIILFAETARIPVDDPATHLELTMVHEAMILEYSGRYLALIEWASTIKQLVLITLIANIFIPLGNSFLGGTLFFVSLASFLVKILVITVVVAIIEVKTVKLRLFSVPNLAALAFILSLLGFMAGFVFGR